MWRFPSAVNIKEWTEVAICILAHHLVCDHFLREFPADCNPWQYLYFDLQLFRKLFDYFFFLGQQEHTYFAVFCRRVMLPVDAAVRTAFDTAEFLHDLFSCMHCHSMLPGSSSSYLRNVMSYTDLDFFSTSRSYLLPSFFFVFCL